MPRAAIGDIEIYYERQGEGPPLLFISGTGGDLRVKPNIFDGPFVKAFDVLAYDQRGLGQSSKPDAPYSMAGYGDDAARLMDHVGWEPGTV
jgi:3-oxoadipate enol-lactonase